MASTGKLPAREGEEVLRGSKSLPAIDGNRSERSMKGKQMKKRMAYMKRKGFTPRQVWRDPSPLTQETPFNFPSSSDSKYCRVAYNLPRKAKAAGGSLVPLPNSPVQIKVPKTSTPKPPPVFMNDDAKNTNEQPATTFITQSLDGGKKPEKPLLNYSSSSDEDWDSSSDTEIDLDVPLNHKELNDADKYYGKEGKQYTKSLYREANHKNRIRRNPVTQEQLYDRPPSATRRFIDNCHRMHLSPEPLLVRKTDAPLLSLAHKGVGSKMMSALNDPLLVMPNISELDLTDCRMEDEALTRVITMIQTRERDKGLSVLKLSENALGEGAVDAMCKLLAPTRNIRSQQPTLVHLKLERCKLDCKAVTKLSKALHDNSICESLSLSRNLIGSEGAHALAEMVQYNKHIVDLDLSWNGILGEGAVALALGLAKSHVKKLNLKLNGFGRCKAAGVLGKWIPYSQIEELDLTGNHVTELPVCILMNGVQLHEKLKRVILNENPIGKLGVSSVLRALDTCISQGWHKVIELHRCSCDIVTPMDGEAGMSMAAFDFLEPAGLYDLDTENPEQYALACEILRIMNTRNGFDFRRVEKVKDNGDGVPIRLQRADKGFLQDKKGGTRCILTDGKPSPYVLKATGEQWVIPDEPTKLRFDVMVREHLPKPFNVISREGYEEIYRMVSYPHTVPNRLAIANAACETFYFSASQVERLCATFHKDIVADILPSFLMRICSEDQEGADMLDRNKGLLIGKSGKLFCRELPTDNYVLDLSDSMDRHLCMTLLRINNDDRSKGLKEEIFRDTSQYGDHSNFRNVTLNGEKFDLIGVLDKNHSVPRQGFLSFDFVTKGIPPLGTKATKTPPDDDDIESIVTFRKWLRNNYISCDQLINFVIEKLPKPKDWMTLDAKITALFHLLDEDDGGEVDKMEVLEAILKRPEVGDFMCQIPELEPLLEPRTFGPAFDAIDQDGGGTLDLDEFRQMCGIATDIAEVAQAMFEADSDDEWDEEEEEELRRQLTELVHDKLNLAHKAARERMKNGTLDERLDAVMGLFEECDEGDKEYLMPPEFAQLTCNLGIILSQAELDDAIERIDEDGNGQIEIDEYLDWWGDDELTERYEERMEALENGKPYRLLGSDYKGEPEERLASVRSLFDQCDVGDKEYLMPDEFALLSAKLGVRLSEKELEKAIEDIDEDGNGQIEIDEYLEWWGDPELNALFKGQMEALEAGKPYRLMGESLTEQTPEKRLAVVFVLFKVCDEGGKEYLDPTEFAKLSKILGVTLTPFELMKAIEDIDEDGNGQIEIDEYLAWWGDPELNQLFEEFGEEWEPSMDEKEFANEWFEWKKNEPFRKAEAERLEREAIAAKKRAKEEAERQKQLALQKMDRAAYIVAAHPRLVDLENFITIWDHLSESETNTIYKRLGWLNVFDPCSPDRRWYMTLTIYEQWRVACIMVKLAIVEPGENWVWEHYYKTDADGNSNPRPGWQLPVSWATKVPKEEKLVLTYSSTGKGCAPVWSERLKMRKRYSLVHPDAPLPVDKDQAEEQEEAVQLNYTAFIRLVSGEYALLHLVNQAKNEVIMEAEKARRALLDSDEEDEFDDGFFETTRLQNERKDDDDDDGVELLLEYPDDPNERSAVELLEWSKEHFAQSMSADNGKGEDDMEEVLEEEWEVFKEKAKEAVEKDPDITKGFEKLHAIFEQLNW